jgi:hypothetical protein
MGLNVRIYNVTFTHNYKVEYRTNTYAGTYTFHSFQSAGTNNVTIGNLEFDTLYYVKLTDLITGQYVITQIVTHDSKFYDCYDHINFTISASTCSCGDYQIQLIDLTSPNGNHSSVINGIPNSYYIYSGTTHHITGATFITTATTNPSTKVIYQTSGETETPTLIYFFVVHSDGFLTGTTDNCPCYLNQPKRQGGFEVKSICLCCSGGAGYEWRPYTYYCEVEPEFEITYQLTGISTPYNVWYDSDTDKVWVADADNYLDGNIYWFNPSTGNTSESAVTYITGATGYTSHLRANKLYSTFIDTIYKRIYFVGKSDGPAPTVVNGMIIYDITGNTIQHIPYGSNTDYKRGLLFYTDNYIYSNIFVGSTSAVTATHTDLIRVDRINPSGTTPTVLSGLTEFDHFFAGFVPVGVEVNTGTTLSETRYWFVSSAGASSTGNIYIFDSDFNYQSTIILTGQSTTGTTGLGGRYWQSIFYDKVKNKVYVSDIGGGFTWVFQPSSNYESATVLKIFDFKNVMESKYSDSRPVVYFSIDPVSDKLYFGVAITNNVNGDVTAIKKTYEVDRDTFEIKRLITGYTLQRLDIVTDEYGNNSLMGPDGGNPYWGGGSWNTDGKIVFYNNSVGNSNTGNVVVDELQLYNINTGLPTGTIIDNTSNLDQYIAPFPDTVATGSTYEGVSGCPITYTLTCPTITKTSPSTTQINYEVNIVDSVKNNPNIATIKVSALDSGLNVDDFDTYSPPFNNYYSGIFSGLTVDTYSIKVEYLDSGATVLSGCT